MNNAAFVSSTKSIGHPNRYLNCTVAVYRFNTFIESRAIRILHHGIVRIVMLSKVVERYDIRM